MIFGSLPNSSKNTNKSFQIINHYNNNSFNLALQTKNKSYSEKKNLQKKFSNNLINDRWQVLGKGILIKPIFDKNIINKIINFENFKNNNLIEIKKANIIGINYSKKKFNNTKINLKLKTLLKL